MCLFSRRSLYKYTFIFSIQLPKPKPLFSHAQPLGMHMKAESPFLPHLPHLFACLSVSLCPSHVSHRPLLLLLLPICSSSLSLSHTPFFSLPSTALPTCPPSVTVCLLFCAVCLPLCWLSGTDRYSAVVRFCSQKTTTTRRMLLMGHAERS